MSGIPYSDVLAFLQEYQRSRPLPKVSCLIPTYQRDYIIELPLISLLRQNYPGDFDILVLDDGYDKTNEVIRSLGDTRIKHVRTARMWIGDKCNYGIDKISDSDFFALSGSDDMSSPNRLSVHIYLFLKNNIQFSGTNKAIFADTFSEKTMLFSRIPSPEAPLTVGTTFGFSRQIWKAAGGFAKGWHRSGNDTRFIKNVMEKGQGHLISCIDDYFPDLYKECICFQHSSNIWYRDFHVHNMGYKNAYYPADFKLVNLLGGHYPVFKKVKNRCRDIIRQFSVCVNAVSRGKTLRRNLDNIARRVLSHSPNNEIWAGAYHDQDEVQKAVQKVSQVRPIMLPRPHKDYLANIVARESQNPYIITMQDDMDYPEDFFGRALDKIIHKNFYGVAFSNQISTNCLVQPLKLSFQTGLPLFVENPGPITHALDYNHCIFNRIMFLEVGGLNYLYRRSPWSFIDNGYLVRRKGWSMVWDKELAIAQRNTMPMPPIWYRAAHHQGQALLFVWKNVFDKSTLTKAVSQLIKKTVLGLFRLDFSHYLSFFTVLSELNHVGSFRKRQRQKINQYFFSEPEIKILIGQK
jgi:glycosyltransferase involved in cell wall biosynthesis